VDISQIRFKNMLSLMQRYKKQVEFAEAVDTAPAYISQLLGGYKKRGDTGRKIGDDFARKIEKKMKLPYGWMDADHPLFQDQSNVSEVKESVCKVPLISWQLLKSTPLLLMPMIEQKEFVGTSGNYGPNAYALKIEGDAMSPGFPPGSIIVVDPDRKPVDDSYVIARHGDTCVFSQLSKNGTELYLKPSNAQYPVRPMGDAEIIGVAVESIFVRSLI
jgi:SOS-response transcriptional repressor LexA